jgi:hypothetical protein
MLFSVPNKAQVNQILKNPINLEILLNLTFRFLAPCLDWAPL